MGVGFPGSGVVAAMGDLADHERRTSTPVKLVIGMTSGPIAALLQV